MAFKLLLLLSFFAGESILAMDEGAEDQRRVWRYRYVYSRGNNDQSENRLAGGSFQTAEVKFTLIVREDKEKNQLELWLESQNILSTKELKGARNALNYGLLAISSSEVHHYSQEEKEKQFEEATQEEALRISELNEGLVRKKKALLEEVDIFKTITTFDESKIKALQRQYDDLSNLILQKSRKLLEHETNLKALSQTESKASEAIDRLTKLIEKAEAAKKSPNKDAAADQLPIPHLKNLLAMEKKNLSDAQVKLEMEAKLESETRGQSIRGSLDDIEAEIREVRKSYDRTRYRLDVALNELKLNAFTPHTPRSIYITSSVRGERGTAQLWVQYQFENKDFVRDVRNGYPFNPEDSQMSATLYLGTTSLKQKGRNSVEGIVALTKEANSNFAEHRMAWKVNLEDGEFIDVALHPADNAPMLRLQSATVQLPDSREETPISNLEFLPPFQAKPASVR